MKHSKVVPLIVLKKEKFSILQIAGLIIEFYHYLAKENPSYNFINVISENDALYPIINIQESNSIQMLAEEILHRNIDDIKKIDGIDDPGLGYCRDGRGGFHIGLQTKTKEDTLLSLTYSFYPHRNVIGPLVVNESCFNTFEKAKHFLIAANRTFSVQYSVIKISDRALNKITREYKAPMGWITYFSKDYEVPIPDDLKDVEYEYVEDGKYLILSREDISVNNEMLESLKKMLVKLMKQIESISPAYSMRYTPPSA